MADERALRLWLREEWPAQKFGELIWTEAAHGGTVGAPDVAVPLGGAAGYCPVELKWWHTTPGHVHMTSRPAQKRLHLLAHARGCRTAYLAMLPTGDKVLLPGGALKHDNLAGWAEARPYLRFVLNVEEIRRILKESKFWRLK